MTDISKSVRSNEYKYQPLPSPSCIRLIHLNRAAASDPIHCSALQITDLDNEPEFVALSYSWLEDRSITWLFEKYSKLLLRQNTWVQGQNFKALLGKRDYVGDDEARARYLELKEDAISAPDPRHSARLQTIFIDGKSMAIQPNLYSALLRLRKTRPGWYWIDAVCINQKDTQERSAQVQMMDRIYQSAAEVVVWLGEVPMLLVPGFQKLHEKFTSKPGTIIPDPVRDDYYFIFPEVQQATVFLLTRRWFRRLWVVQELCLARRPVFVIGDHEFDSQTIASMVPWLEDASESSMSNFVTMFFPAWLASIKKIPAMLNSTTFFLDGHRWDVREWLEMALRRKATDPRDLVFAGLSLMDAEGLKIDQSLQLAQGCSPSGTPHQRLWEVLHADYDVDTSFVLVNLAACLLTHWDVNALFSTTLRYRTRATRKANFELPLFKQPSWAPAPAHWNTRPSKPVFLLSNASGRFPLPVDAEDPGPKISVDGTTLLLTAVKLDTISEHRRLARNLFADTENEWTELLDWIALSVPRIDPKNGNLGLDTCIRVVLSKYRMEGPLTQFSEAELLAWFCIFLDSILGAKTKKNGEQDSEPKSPESTKNSEDIYAKIKARHPDAPWPDHTKDASQSKTIKSNRLIQIYVNESERSPKEKRARLDELKKSLDATSFGKRYAEDWSTQSMFITKEGYMGIGPNVLRDGDAVFLIKGGNMPYIFAHADDVLRRRATRIREQLDDKTARISEDAADNLRKELEELEGKIGSKDGWQLVGETYIEGVMNREVAQQMGEQAQRYGFV
jgi:hypothetical protein